MNTREQVELDTTLTELRGEMASLKGEIVVLKERCAYLESHTGKPAAWQVTHHHITNKRDNYLVFKANRDTAWDGVKFSHALHRRVHVGFDNEGSF